MSIIDGRFVKKNAETLKTNASKEVEVKIKSGGVMQKTVDGLEVKVNDTTTAADNLWSSSKVSNELSQKASITYVDNAIAGLKWKEPAIDFKTQAEINLLTPLSGDRYIVTDGVNQNYIYQYKDGVTTYTPPEDGWTLVLKSNDRTYTYDPTTTTWLDIGGIAQSEQDVVEEFTLTAQNITDKKVTMTYTPVNASYVKLDVVGGCAQDNGADFSVNTATKEVSWSGLGLDVLLEAGDVLRISYSKLA
ncbi:MAG: hypothetical protein HYS25_00845 [Ignavibacteriales bacterium]|nr:hypothetical protein [Ignavibacteriales bacterium]